MSDPAGPRVSDKTLDDQRREKSEVGRDKVQSQSAKKSSEPIEDAGAWLVALAAFCTYFMSWGVATGFGAFQSFYTTDLLSEYPPSTISWIGSVQNFFLVTTGVVSGPFYDRGYFRSTVGLGCALMVVGFMLLSLCSEYWQVLLCQGVVFGVGSGCAYLPAIAAVSERFGRNRAVAMGLTTAGGSVGGIIFPILVRRLQPSIGFGWTARVIGFIELALAAITMAILGRERKAPGPPRQLFHFKAFAEAPFGLFCVAIFAQFLAYWVPFFYIPTYARTRVHLSPDLSFYTLSIVNAASTLGRILPSFAVKSFGAMPVLGLSLVASIALLFGWIGTVNAGSFITFCVLWGFISGILPSVVPVALTMKPIIPDMSVIGTRMGMCWLTAGIGVLIGTPIAGALVDINTANFLHAQIFAGAIMLGGLLSLIWPWIATNRAKSVP